MKVLRSLLAPCASLLSLACTPAPTTGGAVSPVTPAPATEAPDEAAILASSDLPPQLPEPLPDDPLGVTVHRLGNGMTVYLSTVRDEPQIHAWIVVRAGGRMDPADSTGLAHYLEHMLFKGTDELGTLDFEQESAHVERVRQLYAQLREATGQPQRQAILAEIDAQTLAQAEHAIPNEFDRLYGALGVEGLNAWTSSEETVYLATVPSNRLEQWARVESERFGDPVFRLFYPELEAVYEEKNLSLDEPVERLDELVMPRLFPEHPYGTQTILGSVEHLRTPAYQDMVEFFEQHYVPNNMAVVLVGDIDADTALPVLERELGRMRPRPLVAPPPGALPELVGRQQVELLAEGEEQITLRWPTVAVGHADEPALQVLGTMLGDPAFGRLETELVLPQEVTWAAAGSSIMNEAGYFQVDLGLRPGQRHEDVEAMALRVIGSLRRGELTDADVEAAKLHRTVAVQRQRESAFMRAYWLLESFVEHRTWEQTLEHERALQRVTAKDVVRVAAAYLGDAYVAGYRREGTLQVPRLDKPKISPVPVDASRRSPFFEAVQGMPVSPLQPRWAQAGRDYQRRTLAAGELIAVPNVRNELFSVELRVERGYRAQPRLCLALELLELSGAEGRSAEQVRRELYGLGSRVRVRCGAERSSVTIEGLDRNLEATLLLVDRWLADPSFDDETLRGLLRNTLAERRDELEEDGMLGAALRDYASFGERSPRLARPSNAVLMRARPKALRRLMQSWQSYEHDVLYYGPRSADEVAAIFDRQTEPRSPGKPWVDRYRRVDETTIFFLHEDGAKATVWLVDPQPPLPRDQRAVAELYEQIMDGNSGSLVFQEIREARGLAYSAWLSHREGRTAADESAVVGGMSTQADKTPESVRTYLELLQRPMQADRFEEAKGALDQVHRASRIDPRQLPYWVIAWDDAGDPEDPRRGQWEALRGTTMADVEAFAQRVRSRPLIIAVIGDRERVGLPRLRQLGPVVEVQASELFGYGPFPPLEPESNGAAARTPKGS